MARQRKAPETGQWEVTMTIKASYVVICDDCTKEQAETHPFEFVVDERLNGIEDWVVESVVDAS